jgi:hypothetical protein
MRFLRRKDEGTMTRNLLSEDANLRSSLAELGPAALRELQDVLTSPKPSRDALLRSLLGLDVTSSADNQCGGSVRRCG